LVADVTKKLGSLSVNNEMYVLNVGQLPLEVYNDCELKRNG